MTSNIPQTKLAYSIAEACEATSIGRTAMYAMLAAGRVKRKKIGGRTIIPADSLRALVEAA